MSTEARCVRRGLELAATGVWAQAYADHRMAFGVGMADAQVITDCLAGSHGRALVQALSRAHEGGATLLASCSSTFFLAQTGVLDGGVAITSWWLASWFRRRYPRVELHAERLITEHARVVCAGAAMAQLDLSLHLVRTVGGMELARMVARYLVFNDDRAAQAPYLIPDHVAEGLTVPGLARAAAVSPRTLRRRFQQALGLSPARYLQRLRAETARTLLLSTDWSVGRIAREVGYSEDGALRSPIREHFDGSPSRLRRRGFSAAS